MSHAKTEHARLNQLFPFPDLGYGVGLRTQYYTDFLKQRQPVGWLEVHSENYFNEGIDFNVLETLRADYPISLHGVGLGIGSAQGYCLAHVEQLKKLASRIEPALISEHLCWSSVPGRHMNDLLPLPLIKSALDLVCERVDHLQSALKQRILLENIAAHVRFSCDEMSEAEFLRRVAKRTGCGILLNITNLYVNQINHGESAEDALNTFLQLPENGIGEIHLSNHQAGHNKLINHHGSQIDPAVWQLYEKTRILFNSGIPTLIELDGDIPELARLFAELKQAKEYTTYVNREYA